MEILKKKDNRSALESSTYASEGTIRGKEKDESLSTKLTARLPLRNWISVTSGQSMIYEDGDRNKMQFLFH